MRDKNLQEIAILHEELEYRPKISFKSKDNEEKYSSLAKKVIFNRIKSLGSDSKLDQEIIKKTLDDIKTNIINNKKIDFTSFEEVELKKSISNKKELKDLKKKVMYHELSSSMKVILTKELTQLEERKVKLTSKQESYESKKSNYFNNKMKDKLNIAIAKNNLRTKDVKSFISNGATYRKVYLSDEPPLTPAGWIKLFISYGLMIFWAMLIIWPLAELFRATTNDLAIDYLNKSDYKFGFDSFNRLFNNTDYTKWLTNTIIIAAITSAITVFLALLMGYAFSRFRFKGKKTSLLSVMILQMVPTMASLTVFYVLYTILNQKMGLSGHVVLILIYVGGGVAGNTFIMKGYMDSISKEIDEAAKIDGLSQWRIFTRIIIPLTKPMIALVALWSFIGPFGDYILPGLLLSKSEDFTLARGLRTLTTDPQHIDQAAFAAGAIIVAVPISCLFIALRNFLVGGITAGGVKG